MKTCDLLPVRYGMQVEDEPTAARVLARRRAELLEALDRVRGAVELSVRVAGESSKADSVAPASGAEYLRAKARAAAHEDQIADRVHKPLERMARAARRRPRRRCELLCAAYLVDREAVAQFGERVAQLQREHPDLKVLCTGPWPPYSFVGE
jgi:gas vesicle protein GvpL/GvpF